jgi:hypothetical protein
LDILVEKLFGLGCTLNFENHLRPELRATIRTAGARQREDVECQRSHDVAAQTPGARWALRSLSLLRKSKSTEGARAMERGSS